MKDGRVLHAPAEHELDGHDALSCSQLRSWSIATHSRQASSDGYQKNLSSVSREHQGRGPLL